MAAAGTERHLAYEDWVEEARAASLAEYARTREPRLRRNAREWVGPCPACGGDDRFSISLAKNIFFCRKAERGGDVISLVQYVEGVDFRRACEILTNRPAPGREGGESATERAEREAALQARRARAEAEALAQAKKQAGFRLSEIVRANRLWKRSERDLTGTPVEAYLARRGLTAPAGAHLRYAADLPYFVMRKQPDGRFAPEELMRGPAMVAGVIGPDGRFTAAHLTWIDLSAADGKARVVDPQTGELQPAKKVRGSVHGARIELVRVGRPTRMLIGEGIETSLSPYRVLVERGSPLVDGMAVWSSVNLGNLCGRALGRVRHPTLKIIDGLGRERAKLVGDDQPDPDSIPMPIPETVTELWLLGDGDSDRFETEQKLRRAKARYAAPGRAIHIAWSDPGRDFNKMLMDALGLGAIGAAVPPASAPPALLRGAA